MTTTCTWRMNRSTAAGDRRGAAWRTKTRQVRRGPHEPLSWAQPLRASWNGVRYEQRGSTSVPDGEASRVACSRMRSLHVITSDARRGAETFAVNLAASLTERGTDARTVALAPSTSAAVHDVLILGPSRRSPSTLLNLRSAAKGADVVVAHGSSTLEACAIGLVGLDTPFVYRSIGDPSYWVTDLNRQRVVGAMLRRARSHVALWPGAAKQLTERYRISPERIAIIPNAVNADDFAPASQEERDNARRSYRIGAGQPCLAFVGAFTPEKNVEAAIDACAAIGDAVLLLAGDGPLSESLQHHARQAVGARARFLGPLTDPRSVYAAADLLLLPSHSEGMPAVLLEAGLMGRPTVATAVGAVPDIIEDGHTGFLAPPAERSLFISRVRDALTDAENVGKQASEAFRERFSFDQTTDAWIEVLKEAADTYHPDGGCGGAT